MTTQQAGASARPPAVPRHAATLVVARDGPGGIEVLLLQRADKGDHNSLAWVFPGGLVDPGDRRCHVACAGLDDAAASKTLGVPEGGLDYYVAAIRECFEEAGLLFAMDAGGRMASMEGETGARLHALRKQLHGGHCELADICRDFGLRLAADRLHYIAHWLTPVGRPKRFDTRFFLAVLPQGQTIRHDAVETLDHVWLPPAVALSPENSRRIMTPTRAVIETVGRFADTNALLAWARSPREVKRVAPRLGMTGNGLAPVQPTHPAWAEVSRIEAQGQGPAWSEIRPGVAVRLSARVLRLTSGFNSYLVGSEGRDWAVIDPPVEQDHIEALIAAATGPIRWILLTGTGASAGAAALAARTGAQLREPAADAAAPLALSPDTTLHAVRHPVDAPERIAYLLVEEQTLFTGTAAVDRATAALDQALEWIAPGEGFLIRASKR